MNTLWKPTAVALGALGILGVSFAGTGKGEADPPARFDARQPVFTEGEQTLDLMYTRQMSPASQLPARFIQLESAFRDAETKADQRTALESVLAVAQDSEDPEAAAAMSNYAAYRYLYDVDDWVKARELFRSVGEGVVGKGESPKNTVDAWRMVGQIEVFRNRKAAVEAYDRAIEAFETAPFDEVAPSSKQYLMSLTSSAWALSDLGDDTEAIARREKALAYPDASWLLIDVERKNQLMEIARSKARLGMGEEAYEGYERVLRAFPNLADDGDFYYFRYEQLNALGLDDSEKDYLGRLKALWLEPLMQRHHLQRCRVGHRLATLQRRADDRGAYRETLTMLIDQLDDAFNRHDRETLREHRLDHIYALSLAELARAESDAGSTGRAIDLYERFVRLFPEHQMAETIERRIARMEQELAVEPNKAP